MSLSLSRVFSTAVSYPTQEMNHAFHTPVFLCFSMINTISNNQVRRVDSYGEGCIGRTGARLWTFIGFMMMFVQCFLVFTIHEVIFYFLYLYLTRQVS
uniref:Transmembrane protein 50B n=1 Tax=Oncorhynchus kisutch TaxID=8019 RepID=A0A8C7FCK2_ONCKI